MRTPPNERLTSGIADTPKARTRSEPAKSCPERRCILTGKVAARGSLIRLAISPEGLVLPDAHAKAPGRGAWLGVKRTELETALAKGQLKAALMRAFKGARLEIPADLPSRIETALTKALLDRLGLELRAGNVVLGTARIEEQARSGRAELLLHACDASEDGRKKLDQAWRVGRDVEGSGERGIVLPLDRAALSVALGRDNVVHLALNDSAAAGRVLGALGRLLHFLEGTLPSVDIGKPGFSGCQDEQLNA
ncbi:MAG: nucleic-acid-binding protein [Sphingomonadales bacterium BRH_c3]|nr:MAG: nucleic-acid-binding protein [Sphingomonadales bacterium BRH_c3]